jgi:hypothetical protein
LAARLSPTPFTRFWKSAQSLNGPALLRSSRITLDMLGPMPLTPSRAAASALLTSTWANANPVDAASMAMASINFLII